MQTKPPAQDLMTALRALANRLTLKARDASSESKRKAEGDPQAEYLRGLAEGYYKAAVELAEVIKHSANVPTGSAAVAQNQAPRPAAPTQPSAPVPPPAPPAPSYDTSVNINDVMRMLEYVGATPRDITPNKDGSYYTVFSRWQNMTDGQRVELIKTMDRRVVILASGRVKDTSDPFVHFAFTLP